MRDIKFRAYVKHIGWLVPVEQIHFDVETVEVDLSSGQGDTSEYNFDEIVLMQYTGLKDCNGREIYEGDAVVVYDMSNEFGFQGIVGFINGMFTVADTNDRHQTYNGWTNYDIKVTGNVLENPELLN